MSYNYLDRDISWLGFNQKVIEQTEKGIPLAEKIQFIGIASSNLDELFKVRIASRQFADEDVITLIKESQDQLHEIEAEFKVLNKVRFLNTYGPMKKERKYEFDKIFTSMIYPVLTPIRVQDTIIPKDKTSYIFIKTKRKDKEGCHLIEIPSNLNRFVIADRRMILLEDLIINNLSSILKGVEVIETGTFRVLRNAEMFFNDNQDVFDMLNKSLKDREKSNIIRLDFSGSYELLEELKSKIELEGAVINKCDYVDLSVLKKFNDCFMDATEKCRSFSGANPFNRHKTIFEIIDTSDRIAHHPYESFDDTVVRFIQEAAESDKVKSIKITLYRVTEKSKIVEALLQAADSGKVVTVFVELKARFDEKNNIRISKILQEAGINIIFGPAKIKTHCKICVVTYQDGEKTKVYSHIGTGNYNEANSKIYTDYSYFTCDKKIGSDLTRFFNLLTSDQDQFKSKEIIYAPYNLREEINELMDKETKSARKGKSARIIIKCNNLTDEKICDKLREAAAAGVKIICIVRSSCILNPEKNIKIYSLVGRFLEHSRVYIFGKKDPTILIGSSDLMYRNLNLRNEILINVENKKLKNRILRDTTFYIKDTYNSYEIEKDYKYKKKKGKSFDAHAEFIEEAN